MAYDMYEEWVRNGKWPEVASFIKECASKMVSQREMCNYLKMNECHFSRLKKKHPEMQKVIDDAKVDLKKNLIDALYKKAVGYEYVTEETIIEDQGKGKEPKRKVHKTRGYSAPDTRALIYLLTKNFGKEYSERYEELLLAERKLEEGKEEWKNESTLEDSD